MDNFRAALGQYLIGTLEVADLQQAIDRAMAEQADAGPRLTELLDELYRSGRLPHQIYALLKRRVQTFVPESAAAEDDGATRFQLPPVAPADDGATRFQLPPAASAADDATRFQPPPGAAGGPAQPGATATGSFIQPPYQGTSTQTGAGATGTSGTGHPSGSNWSHPSQWSGGGPGANQPVEIGSVIKGRFVLESVLGQGGMGKVFKARDLRKEEAQDRNPFVALKILNEDFKRHPQALQALQREARKAQDLAHPNIVTVWDFDREGDTVFMTMEQLEGESLDKFTKRHSLRGVPVSEALILIEGLANGLAYAHRQGVVHSDFKPANAFLTKSGDVKIFDFGIARAAKSPTDLEGEKTLFDAGELGALTPAYASCEMLEGIEPDPRDDIYALAIVAYELIGGRHPFDKKSAVKARDEGIKPERLKALSTRQWRALARGLAFAREERSPSVEVFLEGIKPPKQKRGQTAAIAVAAAALVTVLALFVPQLLAERQVASLIATLTSGQDDAIAAALPKLEELPLEQFRSVFAAEATQAQFIAYYSRRARELWDPASALYEYDKARAIVAELGRFFPDSRSVGDLERRLQEERDDTIANLYQELDRVRQEGLLIREQGKDNVVDVLGAIASIDPGDPRLRDQAVPIKFAEVAGSLLDQGDTEFGSRVIEAGLLLAANDVSLVNLRDRARNLRERLRREQRVAQLETVLAEQRAAVGEGADPTLLKDSIVELAGLDEGNAVLIGARRDVERLLDARLTPLLEQRSYAAATRLLDEFAGAASGGFVEQQRGKLDTLAAAFQSELEKLQTELNAAIEQDRLDDGSRSAVALLEQLAALGATPDQVLEAAGSTAEAFGARGLKARNEGRWEDARAALAAALALNPPDTTQQRLRGDLDLVDEYRQRAAVAEEGDRQQLLAEQRQADIDRLLASFSRRLEAPAFAVAEARRALADLRALTEYGAAPPGAQGRIATRLRDEVERLTKADEWSKAVQLAEQSNQLLPDDPVLTGLLAWVQAENATRIAAGERRQIEQLTSQLNALIAEARLDQAWDEQARGLFTRYAAAVGAGNSDLAEKQRRVAELLIGDARRFRGEERFDNAAQQLERAAYYAPSLASLSEERAALARSQNDAQQQLAARAREADIERLKNNLNAEAARGNAAGATRILDELKSKAPQDPFVLRSGPELIAQAYLDLAGKEIRDGRLERAQSLIGLAKGLAPGYLAIAAVESELKSAAEAVATATPIPAPPRPAPAPAPARPDTTADRDALAGIQRALAGDQPLNTAAIADALQGVRSRNRALLEQTEPEMVAAVIGKIDSLGSSDPAAAQQRLEAARTIFSGNARLNDYRLPQRVVATRADPCANPDLVGRGKMPRAMCRDPLGPAHQGPPMVVIPSGGPLSRPVAISKYEIMVGDYNAYCELSGKCAPRPGERTLPITGVSVAEAVAFVEWLAATTGARYRLPQSDEWEYAASAAGSQPPKDFNCEVRQNSVLIKGVALMPVNTGDDNGWGLKNYVGNAQEWVRAGDGWEVRGGAHTTSMSQCDVKTRAPHSGAADAITGFRVLRELG